jgi:hypothetical protein
MSEAISLFRSALNQKPNAVESLFGLAAALYTEGDMEKIDEVCVIMKCNVL